MIDITFSPFMLWVGSGAGLLSLWLIMRWRRLLRTPSPQDKPRLVPHKHVYELYGNQLSYNTHCLRLILHSLGIGYRYHEMATITTGYYGNSHPRYLRINPTGELPTLVHNGLPICGREYLLAHILRIANDSSLWPKEPALRESATNWLQHAIQHETRQRAHIGSCAADCLWGMRQPLDAAAMQKVRLWRLATGFLLHSQWRDPLYYLKHKLWGVEWIIKHYPYRAVLQHHRNTLLPHLKSLQGHLKANGGPYICGEQITLADFAWGSLIHWIASLGYYDYYFYEGAMPHMRKFYEQMQARPEWPHLLEMFQEPKLARSLAAVQESIFLDPMLNFICYIED